MSIYHWKLGDIALARVCKKVYAKVKVVKDGKGLFYDDKVLGISPSGDSIKATKMLCYHVEICRTGKRLWLPYTSLNLASRSRPFYGIDKPLLSSKPEKPEKLPSPKKRKIKEDLTLPFAVKIPKNNEADLNTSYDNRHLALKQNRYENAFSEFIRRGKDHLFDYYYNLLEKDCELNYDVLDYVRNVNASTEDKFEAVIKNFVSEKEIDNYLKQSWRYNLLNMMDTSISDDEKENVDSSNTSPVKPVSMHTTWCLVCGKSEGNRKECEACPSCFHLACRREWLTTIIHRKNPPMKPPQATTFVKKILSSTRAITAVHEGKENVNLCPSCTWGPTVGYDDVVWHKLGTCSWWPARVLPPGGAPACLLSRAHTRHQWALRYYGTLNHAWGESSRMCLFLPAHAAEADFKGRDPVLKQAALDACDDYIAVYLT